ncbi:MAG TPA: HlyD family efflux transporter periplasmic adaptor subunit [Gemmatimonadales bacterium]|nr:HlyD family efflux transporter periplasmic adaptor subunit [Gemmatimonadales bacterium]
MIRPLGRWAIGLIAACLACQTSHEQAPAAAVDTAATPVGVAQVERRTLRRVVSVPGRTGALENENVRAPFAGILQSLTVHLGDRVRRGQQIGTIIAQNSDAALRGAEAMLAAAHTPAERADAERATELAKRDLITMPLQIDRPGVVIARTATVGERLGEGEPIVSIADSGSVVFIATIPQSDAAKVATGQPATIHLAALGHPLRGTVHGLLPADTAGGLSLRALIDMPASSAGIGWFGTADVIVGQHASATAVPLESVLRDDITGRTTLAVVTPAGRAHWIGVTPGLSDSAWIELISPELTPGTRVITTGQVGLPESSRVIVADSITHP